MHNAVGLHPHHPMLGAALVLTTKIRNFEMHLARSMHEQPAKGLPRLLGILDPTHRLATQKEYCEAIPTKSKQHAMSHVPLAKKQEASKQPKHSKHGNQPPEGVPVTVAARRASVALTTQQAWCKVGKLQRRILYTLPPDGLLGN